MSAALKMMDTTQRLACVRSVNLNNTNIRQSTVEFIIEHAPALKEIRLHNLKMTEKIAKLLVSKCPSLEQVYMDGGRTTDECLELLANGSIRLKSINLHKVENITTNGICHIIKNTNLSFLNFNGISGWDIRTLAPYCAHFTSMDLGSSNNLTDEDLKSLTKQCKKLKFISLKNCRMINDAGVIELIADCPQLTDLNLSMCNKLTRTSVQHALQSLHVLSSLNMNSFKSLHPIQFPRFPYRLMPALVTFDVSYTDITDEDITNLANFCPNLRHLRMAGCSEVTDTGLGDVSRTCSKLVSLDLSADASGAHHMRFTSAVLYDIVKSCYEVTKIHLTYSTRNNITKRTLIDLNDWRIANQGKMVTFNLNDEVVVAL
jgi:Leucine-rich repeat (LRR) protein